MQKSCQITIFNDIIIHRKQSKYSAMFTEPEGNNCFSIIFKGECEKLE